MPNEYQIYLNQVRAALWGEPVSWPEEQTDSLLALHAMQGTGSLVYPAVLEQSALSSYARAQMKSVCVATMQNQAKLQWTLQTAWSALEKAGIYAVLMKGAGLAALYPSPERRAWGDIDLFVGKDQYHPACAVMRETFPKALKFDEELDHYKHYNLIADGISIEVHRVSVGLQHPLDERRYARMEQEGMTMSKERIMLDGLEVRVPEPTFNALFVFLHSWEHMLTAGANMRQLCDLACLLNHYADLVDYEQLNRYLRALHLEEPWALYMKILEKELGWKSSDKHKHSINIAQNYDYLLTDLLSGRMREAKEEMPVTKNRLARKYYTMRQRMANAERIRRYSPSYARHMVATTLLHGASRLFAKDRHWE